jgi:hypothetical protein
MRTFYKPLIGFAALAALVTGFGLVANGQVSNCPAAGCTLAGSQQAFIQSGIQSFVKTYKYSAIGVVPAATQTDLFTISGSASKTVRVVRVLVSGGTSSTASQRGVQIIRRSAADTGGTPSVPVGVSRDTTNSTATAALALFAAVPTPLGTTVGTLDACRLVLNPPATVPDICAFSYGTNNDQTTTLRGVSDFLAINFLGTANGVVATATTDFIDLDVMWTEEP